MIYRDKINVKFYLIRWRYYEEQRHLIEGSERENAVILFNSLRKLSIENRKQLAEKFHDSENKANYDPRKDLFRTRIPIKDEELCKRYKLSKEKYQHKMRLIYNELEKIMLEVCQLMYDKLEKFKLMIGKGLYFKGYLGEERQYNYLLSQSVTEGKTFTVGVKNSEYYDLMSLGFKKVPTK